MKTITLATLTALALPLTAQAAELTRGPMLQQVTTDSAIVVFDLDEQAAAEVRFGLDDLDQIAASDGAAVHHEIELTGLQPDTRYRYAVYVDGDEVSEEDVIWSGVESGAPFSFVMFGDTRSDHATHEWVVEAMNGEPVNLVMHTGDLISDGEEVDQWDTYFEIEGPLMSHVPVYPVIGNHDVSGEEPELMVQYFALPGNEMYYSFDYGNAHFVVLDGWVNATLACLIDEELVENCFDEDQLAWLHDDLEQACSRDAVDHIFVFTHVGPYSSKEGRKGSGQMRALMPLWEQYGVGALFSGHDHYYERGFADIGIPYVISGGGGAPLYDWTEPCEFPHTVEYAEEIYHYMVVEVDGYVVRMTTKDGQGEVIDSYETDAEPICAQYGDGDDDDAADDDDDDDDGGCQCGSARVTYGGAWIALLGLGAAALRRRAR